jgi:hypothetical protein
MTGQTRTRRWLAALAALLIGLGLALGAAEALARIFFDEPVQPRFVTDPGYGVRWNQARVDTRHYVPGEYDVRVTTNSIGLRGQREYELARIPETHRVLLLGDSFTFGFGVEDEEVVSAELEDLLNARGAEPRAEVVNMGVSGFGQAEELVTWRERARHWRPDVVVMLYFDNDIGNNAVSKLFAVRDDGSLERSAAEYMPGARLQESLYAIAPLRWLFEYSEAWNLVRNRLSQLVQNARLKEQGLKTFNDATAPGVALTRALIAELARDVAAAGAQPVVLVIPNRDIVSNFPLTEPEVAALGATLVDGRDFLATGDYYRLDGHWRPSGHRKAAEALAAALAQR